MRARLAIPLLLGLLSALLVAPFYNEWGGMEDEAVAVAGAQEVVRGHLPYRDFDTRHTPGSYFVTAVALRICADPFLCSRGGACVLAALLGCFSYLFVREGLGMSSRWALLAWWLVACTGVTHFPVLSYHWFSSTAALAGATCLAFWARQPSRTAALVAGLGGGLTFWFLQSDGVALLFAALMLGVFPNLRRQLGLVLAGAGLSSLMLWLPLVLLVGVGPIWQASVGNMPRHLSFNHVPYSLEFVLTASRQVAAQLSGPSWTFGWAVQVVSTVLVWWFKYGLFFPLMGLGLLAWRGAGRAGRVAALMVLAFWLSATNRQDMLYFNYFSPLYYALFCHGASRLGRAGTVLAGGVALVFGLQYWAMWEQSAGYNIPIRTPSGTYMANSAADVGDMAAVNAWRSQAGDSGPIFAYPYRPTMYSVMELRPATRYLVLVPLLYSREALHEAVAQIRGQHVQWILRTPLSGDIHLDYPTVDPRAFEAEQAYFDAQILDGFELVRDGRIQIWRRKR